ncbi:MAG: hypothetical protein OEM52_01075 [bacterium]|nr:hypothetical protein [bacterium]
MTGTRRIVLAILLALPLLVFAQQTMTLEQERVKGELDFPNLTIYGGKQSAQFPSTALDLKPDEVLSRVPKVMVTPDPIERVQMGGQEVVDRSKTVAK